MAYALRPFLATDLLHIGQVNLDPWVENFSLTFYHHYLTNHPDVCFSVEFVPTREIIAYLYGKIEGEGKDYHSHITAITVSSKFRRQGIASMIMDRFEEVSNDKKVYYADLFVRSSNKRAIEMYKNRGYVVYREVINYYDGKEDAYDMRKPLDMDPERQSVEKEHKRRVMPDDVPE